MAVKWLGVNAGKYEFQGNRRVFVPNTWGKICQWGFALLILVATVGVIGLAWWLDKIRFIY